MMDKPGTLTDPNCRWPRLRLEEDQVEPVLGEASVVVQRGPADRVHIPLGAEAFADGDDAGLAAQAVVLGHLRGDDQRSRDSDRFCDAPECVRVERGNISILVKEERSDQLEYLGEVGGSAIAGHEAPQELTAAVRPGRMAALVDIEPVRSAATGSVTQRGSPQERTRLRLIQPPLMYCTSSWTTKMSAEPISWK